MHLTLEKFAFRISYKWSASGGYGTYRKHLERAHSCEAGITKTQTQISRYATNTFQLFHFSDVKNRNELARMVAVEHLSFSFGKKLGFINYCKNALNP